MKDTKRLGPQNPLSWIKDSRESPAKSSEPAKIVRSVSSGNQTFRFQSNGVSPVEVIVVMNGDRVDHRVKIEVAQEGQKAMNIEFKTSNGQEK